MFWGMAVSLRGVHALSSVQHSVRQGMSSGRSRMQKAVEQNQRGEIVSAALEQKQAEVEIKTAVKVAQSMDKNLATLIDELA